MALSMARGVHIGVSMADACTHAQHLGAVMAREMIHVSTCVDVCCAAVLVAMRDFTRAPRAHAHDWKCQMLRVSNCAIWIQVPLADDAYRRQGVRMRWGVRWVMREECNN